MRQRATRLTGLSAGGDLSLVTRAINAIRRNQGVLYWPADNFSGMWTDSTGLSPVTNVGDVLGLLGDRTQPMAARRNLLTWSQAFDNADWTKARLTVTTGLPAHDGLLRASKITPTAVSGAHLLSKSGVVGSGTQIVNSFTVKADGYSFFAIIDVVSPIIAHFNLSTGAVVSQLNCVASTASLGGGWYRCSIVATTTTANAGIGGYVSSSSGVLDFTGDGTSGVLVSESQLELGSTLTPYQRIDEGQGEWFTGSYTANTAAYQATTASKPLLTRVPKRLGVNLVSNGTFDANIDGWTSATGPGAHAWASGALRRAVGGGDGGSYVDVPVIAGRTYQVGGAVFNLTGSGGCTMNFYSGGGFTGLGASIGSTGSALLVAQTNNIRPYLYTDTARGVDFDNIEVREVLEWSSYAMSFDGNNDFLQTGITTGNEGWVCAGVTVAPGETLQTIVSSGAGDTTQKGVFLVTFNGTAIYAFLGNGTARQQAQTTITAGVPQVASMGWSASGVFAGVNGTESASTAFSGDVTGPSPLRIGQYIGGTLPLNGPMTATVICPVLPSAADRALIRRFIGSLQGQTL